MKRLIFSIFICLLVASCASTTQIVDDQHVDFDASKYSNKDGDRFLDKCIHYHYRTGETVEAIENGVKAKLIFDKTNNQAKLAACYHELGMLYSDIGEYNKAIDHYEKGIVLDKTIGNQKDLSAKYANLALTYNDIGNQQMAVEYLKNAIEINTELKYGLQLCTDKFNLAGIYINMRQYTNAIGTYNDIMNYMNLHPEQQKDAAITQVGVQAGLFKAYLFNGDQTNAKKYLDIINAAIHRPFHSGLYFYHINQYENATKEFLDAMNEDLDLFDVETKASKGTFTLNLKPTSNPTRKQLSGLGERMACQIGLGLSLEKTGHNENALKILNTVIENAENQRDLLKPDQKQYYYQKRLDGFSILDAYEASARLYFEMGDSEKAYMVSETMAARLFSEEYARTAKKKTNLSEPKGDFTQKQKKLDEITEQLRQLRLAQNAEDVDEIDKIYAKKKNVGLAGLVSYLIIKGATEIKDGVAGAMTEDEIEDLEEERNQLFTELNAEKQLYGKYMAAHYPKPEQIANLELYPNELVLKFEVTEESLLAWLIKDKTIIDSRRIAVSRTEVDQKVQSYRSFFDNIQTASDLEKFDTEASFGLYGTLFDGFQEHLKSADHLIIIPDETLTMIPYGTLVTSLTPDVTYLSDQCAISSFQSASALSLYRNLNDLDDNKPKSLFVLSDPAFSVGVISKDTMPASGTPIRLMRTVEGTESDEFCSLPETRNMAADLCQMFDPEADHLSGPEATKNNILKKDLAEYRYLVFATHGVLKGHVNLVDEPALVLTPASQGEKIEGFLTAGDVMALDLDAELVSLTACHTGEGELLPGEGVMGLFRSFQHAGADNVLATLYAVSEEASTEFNRYFFKRIKDGATVMASYRNALKDLRQNGYDNPFYWGAFTLVGIAN